MICALCCVIMIIFAHLNERTERHVNHNNNREPMQSIEQPYLHNKPSLDLQIVF